MERILFTGIGKTDPVKNRHDGAIFHILRHYSNIKEVYIYCTSEMWLEYKKYDTLDMAFNHFKAINNKQFNVNFIESGVTTPEDFNVFYEDMLTRCNEIVAQNENCELIINISSGTPAMKANLLLLSTDIDSSNVKCVQVVHPYKVSDSSIMKTSEDYDIYTQLLENEDDLKPNSENRCKEVVSNSFKKIRLKSKIESILSSYNYEFLNLLIKDVKVNKSTRKLIDYVFDRVNLRDKSSVRNEYLSQIFPKMNFNYYNKNIEYYLIIRNLQRSKKVSEFLIRLNPLLVRLMILFLEKCFNINLEEVIDQNGKIDKEIFEEKYSDCFSYLNSNLNYSLQSKPFSINLLNIIIKYYNEQYGGQEYTKYLFFFNNMNKINNERNCIAHEITVIDDTILSDKYHYNSNNIIAQMDELFRLIYPKEFNEETLLVYDELNKLIIKDFMGDRNGH